MICVPRQTSVIIFPLVFSVNIYSLRPKMIVVVGVRATKFDWIYRKCVQHLYLQIILLKI
jgi:hypothetical protein